ncbi:diacylglycerol/lipid kinase family protein [Tomitella gaofuii]|uniref:diacylglycerol/lipid kinase family protein n=1 Tax=Tomitella gaofuii TaxID=2760083 RepID=UPI0015FA6C45|nr:diacylglycerol kinase family protein [Tomitella gaofuii]
MHALLIVNPHATSTTPAGRDLLAHALASRLELEVVHTTHRGHAAELSHRAALEGTQVVVVHGGDGTVNEAVNGLLGPPHPDSVRQIAPGRTPAVCVVPGGSANVFARSLGIRPDPVEATNQVLDLLASRQRRRIGLGHCDNRWFTFTAGMGVDALVVEAMEAARRAGHAATPSRYLRTTVRVFLRNARRPATLTVELPGREPVDSVHYAFVSNTSPWTYLGAREVRTNPGTRFDTGLGVFGMRSMDTVTSLRLSRQLLSATAQPKNKNLVRTDDTPCVRIRSAEPVAFQIDGDYLGVRTDVTFSSVPGILDVVAPAEPD